MTLSYVHDVTIACFVLIPTVVAISMFVTRYSKQPCSFTRTLSIISASLLMTEVFTRPYKGFRNHAALFTVVFFVGALLLRRGRKRLPNVPTVDSRG